jgi:hypothetical protein
MASRNSRTEQEPADVSAYLAKLQQLARDLEAQGRGACPPLALRLLRQRLAEWVEDLRSVGGHDALADAVDDLANRLRSAIASPANLVAEVLAIAAELAALAGGGPPPPRKSGRAAFWK